MPPATPSARVVLVVGPEEMLAERAVERVRREARDADPETELIELVGAELDPGHFSELVGPTLFGAPRLVVVRGLPPAGAASDTLVAFVDDPADDVIMVVVHDGGAKGKKALDAMRKTKPREIPCARITRRDERLDFVRAEAASAGGTITAGAASALVDAVGGELRELAAACSQLVLDSGGTVDEAVVRRYHVGRAEAKGWTIADRAIEGREAAALEELRWALSLGTEPVLVVGALAMGLRNVARVASRRGQGEGAVASALGMPPWKVKTIRRQVDGWTPAGIERALVAVAGADAEVKGTAAHPAYALERAVREICAARGR